VTQKLLKKQGWNGATVASGFESLSALGQAASSFQILIWMGMKFQWAYESLEVKFVYWSSSRSLHTQHLQLKWFAISLIWISNEYSMDGQWILERYPIDTRNLIESDLIHAWSGSSQDQGQVKELRSGSSMNIAIPDPWYLLPSLIIILVKQNRGGASMTFPVFSLFFFCL